MRKSGFRSTANSGKGPSTISTDFSASRKTSQTVRRIRNGNRTVATADLASNKAHSFGAAGAGLPSLDRREAIRALVPSHHGLHDHGHTNGFAGRWRLLRRNAPQGRKRSQALGNVQRSKAAREAGFYLALAA